MTAMILVAIPVLVIGAVHIRWTVNGTYVRWAEEHNERR